MTELAALLLAAVLSGSPGFHTSPECWPAARYTHRPASAEFIDRVGVTQAPAAIAFDGERSPNRGYQFRHESSDDGARLRIDVEQGRQWLLDLRGAAWQPEVRWVNEKLLFVRVHWGRIQASDLIIDVEQGTLLLHELADNGQIAWEQFQQACGGRCPCEQMINGASVDADPLRGAPLLGLGEIAAVGEGVEELPAPLLVRQRPETGTAARAVRSLAEFATRELSYEQPALLVYAVEGNWLQVALADGQRLWVSSDEVRLHPLEVVVLRRLSYLSRDWDGKVWSEPGAALTAELPPRPGVERSVRVRDARRHQGRSWLQVDIYDRSECESGPPPQLIASGWVPAHQASGEPLVWFYSRGC